MLQLDGEVPRSVVPLDAAAHYRQQLGQSVKFLEQSGQNVGNTMLHGMPPGHRIHETAGLPGLQLQRHTHIEHVGGHRD